MMKNKKVEANLSMVVSKTFSGLNMNALKYLLPVWVSPLSGVTLRCVFAAIAFWIIGMFVKPEISTRKEKIFLFLLGWQNKQIPLAALPQKSAQAKRYL